jgi:hypothetical protein
MARPQKFTDEQIIEALGKSKGLVYVAATTFLKCDPSTIHQRAKKSKAVAAAIEQERGLLVDMAELILTKALEKGDLRAAEFVLRTIGKQRGYVERQEVVQPEYVKSEIVVEIIEPKPRPATTPGTQPEVK